MKRRRKRQGRVPMETRRTSNSQLSLRATSSSHGHLTQNPMIGLTFGRLRVMERWPSNRHRQARYRCRCNCGRETIALGYHLRAGDSRSCRCLSKDHVSEALHRHGYSGNPTYAVWHSMKQRCTCRSIAVSPSWTSFRSFLFDMGLRPPMTAFGRRNRNAPYDKRNCHWRTYNRRSLIMNS
jgi:hypothetical protein